MGVGKSTIGRLIAKKLKAKFIDVDKVIEKNEKMSIKKIFEYKGEKYFRLLEVKTILSLLDSKDLNEFIEDAYNFFLGERHKVTFYDDVVSVLEKLSSKYMLGVLTNGNADVNKLGIGHLFDFSISSMDVRSNKPDKGHFIKARELSKVDFKATEQD